MYEIFTRYFRSEEVKAETDPIQYLTTASCLSLLSHDSW